MNRPELTPGQRIEVLWDRHGWLPGTFDGYTAGDPYEDFNRCMVTMDNGWDCRSPGFHPDCVRAMEEA